MDNKQKKKPKIRNPSTIPAKKRKAGKMKDRRAKKGGATNDQLEYLEDI